MEHFLLVLSIQTLQYFSTNLPASWLIKLDRCQLGQVALHAHTIKSKKINKKKTDQITFKFTFMLIWIIIAFCLHLYNNFGLVKIQKQ